MDFSPLERSLIATLALLAAESFGPLTAREIHEHLLKDTTHSTTTHRPAFSTVVRALATLGHKNITSSHSGRYFLSEHQMPHAQESFQKITRIKKALALLTAVPFLESAAITGSVAFGTASKKSDIDILCIARKKRLWTVRAGALLVAEIFGMRTEKQRARKEKLCFNYFMAPSAQAPIQNVASAHMLAHALLIFNVPIFNQFISTNTWIKTFLYPVTKPVVLNKNRPFKTIKRLMEKMLAGKLGDALESFLQQWQMARLQAKTKQGGDTSHLILKDDAILLHYPTPKNKAVMERYHRIMADMNL